MTLDGAALATDGRYFNQAHKQLDGNWTLLKQGLEDVPTWQEWYDGHLLFSFSFFLISTGQPSIQQMGRRWQLTLLLLEPVSSYETTFELLRLMEL